MRHLGGALLRRAGRSPGRQNPAAPAGAVPGSGRHAHRRRSLGPTAALGAVLLGLAAYVILTTLVNTRATREQSDVLAIDALFAEARTAVALEEVHLRHYQVEPAVAVRDRFARSANTAATTLAQVRDTAPPDVAAKAARLHAEQLEYRRLGVLLIAMVTDRDPDHPTFDRLEVTPAYYTLQQDIDHVSRTYHQTAESQVAALRDAQMRMLVGTSAGFALGLVLVAVIWRLVLGYQRRLIEQADSSEHQALHDPLTGLPNRALFAQRLRAAADTTYRPYGEPAGGDAAVTPYPEMGLGTEPAAAGGGRPPAAQFALMIVDLNGFKAVNDTLGHPAGDQLLVETGRRLTRAARRDDVVARLGGDEFAVLLPDVPDLATACRVGERMAAALRHDFLLDDGPAAVSGSIGIALSPVHGTDDQLLRHADAAMYRAKADGGGVAVYDPRLDAELPDRMTRYAQLRALLDAGDPHRELRLYYQPQVRLRDGAVTAVEALVRWRHPGRGLLQPRDFLPIAEARGLEVPLTYHLLDVAVRQAAGWRAHGRPLTVAVNISPRCLLDADLVAEVCRTVERHGLPPRLLRLEVTETSIMTDPERAVAAIREIHAYGVGVSIDDFGTGFSSLTQLKRLPADELKIDQSFIREMRPGSEDELMVRSAIDLAHNLGLSVVAEGVEDLTVAARLRELSCDYAQGFALSPPVAARHVGRACARARERARAATADVTVTG